MVKVEDQGLEVLFLEDTDKTVQESIDNLATEVQLLLAEREDLISFLEEILAAAETDDLSGVLVRIESYLQSMREIISDDRFF